MPARLGFLKDLNGGKALGKVALLTESDTEFGNQKVLSEQFKGPAGSHTAVTVMKFPFHISQVAIAYNERDRKDDRSKPELVRPSSRLSIPFDETGNPRNVVPSLSPAMTTATDEFVLAKILETISVEDFRYIGIVATDTRDMIFLAAMIRQYCPDVQIFIASGDLLLGHPRYVSSLSGKIVATTYPLFSMAQRWDPPYQGDHRRHLFSHQGDQGIYNATVSLLNEGEPRSPSITPTTSSRSSTTACRSTNWTTIAGSGPRIEKDLTGSVTGTGHRPRRRGSRGLNCD